MNIIGNTVFIGQLVLFCLALSLIFAVGQGLYDNIITVFDFSDQPLILNFFPIIKELMYNITNFVLAYFVILMFVSSAVQRHDLTSYFINFVGGVIVSSIMIFVASHLLAMFSLYGGVYLDLSLIPDWFLENFTYILVINILAGLMSFIFVRRTI